MSKWVLLATAVVLVAVTAGSTYWLTRPTRNELAGNESDVNSEPVADDLRERLREATDRHLLAEEGDATAQFELGVNYDFGRGVPEDDVEAVKWYRLAADQGHEGAQFNLGVNYDFGDGVPEDDVEAVKWYRLAADRGHEGAQFNLGMSYSIGEGVPKDHVEAVKWFRLAAEQGHAGAQHNLGVSYSFGYGVPEDDVEAVKWYRLAADQGRADAQHNLGVSYSIGEGVLKDDVEAVKWFRLAADQGRAAAQNNLGTKYYLGEGVPRNLVEAYKWKLLAAGQESRWRESRDALESVLTPAQIAEGQRLAAAFVPGTDGSAPPNQSPASPIGGEGLAREDTSATGFFIHADGYLITAAHAVEGASRIVAMVDGSERPARVLSVDRANDLALLRVEGSFASIPLRGSATCGLGDEVATLGYPNPGVQGSSVKFTRGDVSSLTGVGNDPRFFQVSVPIQPGNSGGPLLDDEGNVIGVVVSKLDAVFMFEESGSLPENVNYAVKSTIVLSLLEAVPEAQAAIKGVRPRRFEEWSDVVEASQDAVVLIRAYR